MATNVQAAARDDVRQTAMGDAGEIDGTREYAASFAQRRLWIVDRLMPESPVYNITLVADLAGALNLAALETSVAEVVRRHDGLRTSFRVRGGHPRQVVHRNLRPALSVIDLRELDAAMKARTVEETLDALARKPFVLERPPLFSVSVLSLDARAHVLVFSVHHIVFDHWSEEIVAGELAQLYDAAAHGRPSPLSPPSHQYPQIAEAQRHTLEGPARERLLAFWRERLGADDALAGDELPFRRGADSDMTLAGRTIGTLVGAETLDALRRFARANGTSLFTVMLSAFLVLVDRYRRAGKVLVTVPVSGRDTVGAQGVVGMMVNLLPLCVPLDVRESFVATLARVSDQFLSALEHQDLPFEEIVQALDARGRYGATRLSQIVFGYRRRGRAALDAGGLAIVPRDVITTHARFELSAIVVEHERHLDVGLEFNTACYDEADVQRVLHAYAALLEQVPRSGDRPLMDLSPLMPEETARQLREWNGTPVVAAPWREGIVGAIERQARARPDALAVCGGGAAISYGELLRGSGRIAAWLTAQGVGPERPIGVAVSRTIETIVTLLGVLRSGAAYVALDAHAPAARLRALVTEAHTPLVLIEPASGAAVAAALGATGTVADTTTLPAAAPGACVRRHALDPAALAYVLFTSGSTGRPKGVMVSHANLTASTAARCAYYGDPVTRFLLVSPLFFDSSVAGLFWTLADGGALVLPDEEEPREPARLAARLVADEITHVLAIPSLYQAVLENGGAAARALQVAIVAGEACSAPVIAAHQRAPHAARLFNEYGPTEGTVWSTVRRVDAAEAREPVSIGRAVGPLRVYVAAAGGRLLPVGALGELMVGGGGVARGYWRQPAATAARFVPDAWAASPGARAYRTGDWGRWRGDGQLLFAGRRDDEVKLRGHRLHLGEVEQLLRAQPGVADAAAVVRAAGAGAQLLAAVVLAPTAATTGGALRAALRDRLPEALVPARVHVLAALPALPNGKLDRARLLDACEHDRAPDARDEAIADPVEGLIADIWKEVLGRDTIAPGDNFFEIGGHSLLATQMLSRLRALFEAPVSLRAIFEQPTLRAVADLIKRAQRSSLPTDMPLVRAPVRAERTPLAFQQQRLWYLYDSDRASVDYHLPRAMRLRGPLHVAALERAIDEIRRRHEILRTSFGAEDGRPFMIVNPAPRASLVQHTRSGVAPGERWSQAIQAIDEEVRRPFVLEEEAVRFILYRLDADDHVLFVCMHHIVTDGWSLGVLTRELQTLYADFRDGRPASLPELPLQYGDFASGQRAWLQGPRLDAYVDYWERALAGASGAGLAPRRTGPGRVRFAGRSLELQIDADVATALRTRCREAGGTLFMALQTLFSVCVAWHAGIDDIVMGTSVANRRDVRTEGLIGFFANTLPVRTRFDGESTFRTLLANARQRALTTYAVEDVPTEAVVARLRRKGALDRDDALFDTFFVLHNEPIQPLALPGLQADPVQIAHPTTMFQLAGSVAERSDALSYMLHYDSNDLSHATVLALARTFERLLRDAAAAPDTLVADILAGEHASAPVPAFSETLQ